MDPGVLTTDPAGLLGCHDRLAMSPILPRHTAHTHAARQCKGPRGKCPLTARAGEHGSAPAVLSTVYLGAGLAPEGPEPHHSTCSSPWVPSAGPPTQEPQLGQTTGSQVGAAQA